MQYKIFTIPTTDDGGALEEMNRFLRGHKILESEQQLISSKTGSQWHFCVKYLANAQGENKSQPQSKADYKEILDADTFAIFNILRELRKKIADEDGLPVYAVFTNEELAAIAALENITPENIRSIKGIGEKKNKRFGQRLVEYLNINSQKNETQGVPF
ncbi:MAG: HRDC domain-containing protein [Dysgonamonadaceae bacterium]|jgi:superfamily II DNA helicase RecQ|nr:HRDC domain-containing protein [Dysgonamonadaceae bacterium]